MKLRKKRLGRTDYRVSQLCLSTSNFSRYASREESWAILESFREAGGNFIQTSGICPGVNLGDGFLGMPEEVLGAWLKLRRIERSSMVIATRIAFTRPVIGGLPTYIDLVRRCVGDSIRRIGCGYLDLLVVEWTDGIAPVVESMAAFEAVVASGEVRAVVPANFRSADVREALAASRRVPGTIAGIQFDYSLAARSGFESGIAKLSGDHQLALIARAPLAAGRLAGNQLSTVVGGLGQYTDTPDSAAAANAIWPALFAIAQKRHQASAQLALSWVLMQPQVTSVLVSVRSTDQLSELLAATRFELSGEELARLDRLPVRPARAAIAA